MMMLPATVPLAACTVTELAETPFSVIWVPSVSTIRALPGETAELVTV